MKRRLKIGLGVLLFLCIAGFGYSGGTGDTGTEAVELEFFQQKEQLKDFWAEQIDRYNTTNNKGITVTQTLIPYTEAIQVLFTRFASNDAPEIIQHYPMRAEFKLLVAEDRLVNLQDKPYAKNVVKSVLGEITHSDGSFYAIPISLNMYGVFYNVDKFKELGLKPPKTYPEMIALCKQIKAKGETPFVFLDKTNWYLRQQMSAFCALEMPKEKNRAYPANEIDPKDVPELRRACEKFLEVREYGQPNTLGTNYDQANQDFLNEKALMMIEGNWAIPSLEAGKPTFEYAMFPLPADKASDTLLITGIDTAYCICTDIENIEAADDFMSFLCSTEEAQNYADFDGSPSAIKGVKSGAASTQALMDLLAAGRTTGWVHDLYGSGAAPELERLGQKLAADKDIDAYLKDLAAVIDETYQNLAKFKK